MLGSGSVVVFDRRCVVERVAHHENSSPRSRAVSARRAARARAGSSACCMDGTRRRRIEDLDLMLDLCDNIAPAYLAPQQTTIARWALDSSPSLGDLDVRDEFAEQFDFRVVPLT